MIFNNGRGRVEGDYSSVDEIVPPLDKKGNYYRPKGEAFGPERPVWSYVAPHKEDFYSSHISGCQRLPNGNTLICSGEKGIFFEMTEEKKIVWKFINPLFGQPRPPLGGPRSHSKQNLNVGQRNELNQRGRRPGKGQLPPSGPINSVFKAYRYPPDFPGFGAKKLTPGEDLVSYVKKKYLR